MDKKYGFVYVWRDRKHKRYYVGSHWGREDDGYVCSSSWMTQAYKRRPDDFKRRVIARISSTRADLLKEEERWLSMIKPEEIKRRYYNLKLGGTGHWTAFPGSKMVCEKISASVSKQMTRAKRRQISEATRKGMNQEAVKEKIKFYNCDPERRKAQSLKRRKFLESNVERKRISDGMKAVWIKRKASGWVSWKTQ